MPFSSVAIQLAVASLFALGLGTDSNRTLQTTPPATGRSAGQSCERQAFDISRYSPTADQIFFTIPGDFNGDGITDIASKSGVNSTLTVQFGEGNGYFSAPQTVDNNATGGFNLTSGDFNNDGAQDLFTTSKLYLGDGRGGFQIRNTNLAPQASSGFISADLDGDDNLDVAATVFSTGSVEIFFGDGEGNFGAGVVFSMGGSANRLTLADLNGDSIDDIAVVLGNQNSVSVLFGNAGRVFSSPTVYPVPGTGTVALLAEGDIDRDGDIDLLASSTGSGQPQASMAVLRNDGTGALTVEPRFDYPMTGINRVFLFDLDENGSLDIAASNQSRQVSFRKGNNDGTFGDTAYTAASTGISGLIFRDFTGDGIRDLGIPNSTPNVFLVLENDGSGLFAINDLELGPSLAPVSIGSADFNGDGVRDIVSANDARDVRIKFGDGSGGFGSDATIPLPKLPRAVVPEDMNTDGIMDLFVVMQDPADIGATGRIYFGNGNGTFQTPVESMLPDFRGAQQPGLGDLNNDGRVDLVAPSMSNERITLYEQIPSGVFAFRRFFDTTHDPRGITVADLNNDGFKDIAALALSAHVYLGNGTFLPDGVGAFPTGEAQNQIIAADLNKDGVQDLIVSGQRTLGANSVPGQVAVLLGVGKGGFDAPAGYSVGNGSTAMETADFDGDGNLDLAVADEGTAPAPDNRITILYGDGNGGFSRRTDALGGGSVKDLEVFDANGDGIPDLLTGDRSYARLRLLLGSCLPPVSPNVVEIAPVSDVTVTEGDSGDAEVNVSVALSMPSSETVSVRYKTSPRAGVLAAAENEFLSADGGIDYRPARGELRFAPGETQKSITLRVRGDLLDEYDEEFSLYLLDASNALISDNRAAVTIVDNDAPPSISITGTSGAEGNSGVTPFSFTVSLSQQSGKAVSGVFLTAGGTAIPDQDYVSTQGTFSIPAGMTSTVLNVNVNGDLAIESDETFLVQLREPVNATVGTGTATGTINNDDEGGTVAFNSATYNVAEGQASVGISVVRTGGNGGGASVRFRTSGGTATANEDYPETVTTLYFGENETVRNVFIPIYFDMLDEPAETIGLVLDQPNLLSIGSPGTAEVIIQNTANVPNLSLSDASVVEGDNGVTFVKFFARLDRPTQRAVTFNFATSDITATAGVDYGASSGLYTIRPGLTRATLSVPVFGDFLFELDETLQLDISDVANANATDTQAIGRIINDEVSTGSSTSLISINAAGTGSGNLDSGSPSPSFDGNVIAFSSFASDLGATDTNGTVDVYVRNRRLGTTVLASVNSAGTNSGDCTSRWPRISANGRHVAFESCASNLTSTPGTAESVYVRDLQTNQTELVSVSSSGAQVEGTLAAISPDGRYVVFQSRARNVTSVPDNQDFVDVFVRDTELNTTTLVSVNTAGDGPGNTDSGNLNIFEDGVRISGDGRFVLFPSAASNLVTATHNGSVNVFLRDLQQSATKPVSVNLDGSALVGANWRSALCSDNDTVAFQSANGGLAAGDTNNTHDIFLRKLSTGAVTLVSANAAGTGTGNGPSVSLSASADCAFVAFQSTASNLSSDPDTNGLPDVYRRDVSAGVTGLVSFNFDETNSGTQDSTNPRISADGRIVLFTSAAGDLVPPPTDSNVNQDQYLRDVSEGITLAASVNESGTSTGNLPTATGVIAADGSAVFFESNADNLVSNDLNGQALDVFVFERIQPGLPLYDFDGDGETDLSVFRPSESVWYRFDSGAGALTGAQFGVATDVTVAQDYDGDGRTDIAVFREGTWFVLNSSDLSVSVIVHGQPGDLPVDGDYDGDGKADPAVFRNGVWEIRESSDGNIRTVQFGIQGDIPVSDDFDGDGRTDIAVFRAGMWFVLRSVDFGVTTVPFGSPGDVPVEGDFDGDKKADFAVFRPSNGGWFVLSSLNGSVRIVQFGVATDVPVKVDFDADGKRDLAIFRDGVWWTIRSSDDSLRIDGFGLGSDIAIPRALW